MAGAYSINNALRDVQTWDDGGVNVPRFERLFPLPHLADDRPGRVARYSSLFPPGGFGFSAHLRHAHDLDCLAFLNHNIVAPAGMVLSLARSAQMEGYTDHVLFPEPGQACWMAFPRYTGARFVRLAPRAFGTPPTTTDGQPAEMGLCWLGEMHALPSAMQWGDESGVDQLISYQETEYGAPIAYPLSERRAYRGRLMRGLREVDAEALQDFHRRVRGRARPFLFIPDTSRPDALLGRLGADSFRMRSLVPGRVDAIDLSIVEDPWGKTGA